jgi:putative redox protein
MLDGSRKILFFGSVDPRLVRGGRAVQKKYVTLEFTLNLLFMANTRSVTVRMKSDLSYESTNLQGNRVDIDMHDPEQKQAQSPMELLLSALGGCASVDAVLMMKKKRRALLDFFVEVEGLRNDGVPGYYTDITLHFVLVSPDATVEEFEKVVALSVEKYCSVASSLSSKISFTSEVRRSA